MLMNNNLLQRSTSFSPSGDQSWQDAAEIQILRIFSQRPVEDAEKRLSDIPHLIQLRSYLDVMIAELQDVPVGKIAEMFIQLGRIARALGNSKFPNSEYFLEHPELLAVIVRKQRDYGHENIARFGRTGLLVRLHDKVARLENLLESGNEPNNESIEDNIGDVIGYCTIGAMWEEGTFLLSLQGTTVVESARAS